MVETCSYTLPLEQYDKFKIVQDYDDWTLMGEWTDNGQSYRHYIAMSECKEELCMWFNMNYIKTMKTHETVNLDDKKKAVHH